MIVVANASPLCYLALIDELRILPALFQRIWTPAAVLEELTAPGAPERVRRSFSPAVPPWLRVSSGPPDVSVDPGLDRLHRGERQAILLSLHIAADLILLDDRDARLLAAERGLTHTGLLGVIDAAAHRHLLDVPQVVERLRSTSFRIHPSLLRALLERHRPS